MEAKEIIKAYFEAVTAGRFDDLSKYQSPNSTYWICGENSWPLGGWQTPEDMNKTFNIIRERFPEGVKITVRSIIAEGDSVAVLVNNHAVRKDGRIYDNEIVTLMKIEDGLIEESREFLDIIHVNGLFFGEMLEGL